MMDEEDRWGGAERFFDLRPGPGPDEVVQGCAAVMLDAEGRMLSGALGLVVDLALGAPGLRSLAPDTQMTTSHIHIEFLRRPSNGELDVRGRGEMVARLPDSVVTSARITGGDGPLLALATGRFAILASEGRNGGAIRPGVTSPSTDAGAVGEPLEDLPLHRALEARLVPRGAGLVELVVTAVEQLANSRGGVHGGAGILLGEQVCALAAAAVAPSGSDVVELRVAYLRPIPVQGQPIVCRAHVHHRGRSLLAVRGEVCSPGGRVAVAVEALHVVRPRTGAAERITAQSP